MRGREITAFIEQIPEIASHFKGIYALDGLCTVTLRPFQFIIFNTSSLEGEGGPLHWCSLIKMHDSSVEIFNSLGSCHDSLYKANIRIPRVTHFYSNETPVQMPNSPTCGEFCLYFIVSRYYNMDLDFSEALECAFSADKQLNENKVKHFMETKDFPDF